jgi:hypothetical protein
MKIDTPILLVALAGAVGLWFWSRRTESGGQATSDAFDAAMRAARAAEGTITSAAQGAWTMATNALARGIRNNNPGNIDRHIGVQWQGMAPDQSTDGRFVVFTAPEWGIRAIARILRSYMGRGNVTIAQIISTWAPPSENNTNAYIAAVSAEVGIPANAPVSAANIPALIAAIIRHENGQQPYPPDVIAKGIELERTT